MTTPNPSWMRSGAEKYFEFSISENSLFILFQGSTEKGEISFGSLLNSQALSYFKKNEADFKAWLTRELPAQATFNFRLFGSSDQFRMIQKWLQEMGLISGKSVELTGASVFRYIPSENRIQRRKDEQVVGTVKRKTRVLVVDDSETIRKLLYRILSEDPDLECVGTIDLPSKVMQAIEELKPDVLTLDIHMPEMDGITLLKKILFKHSLPAIMISSLSREEGAYVLDALEAGAVDYIQKPSLEELKTLAPLICEKVKNARSARVGHVSSRDKIKQIRQIQGTPETDQSFLIGIGSSTGGTEALKEVLTHLPSQIPPILIVQHIPPVFSKAFADRMNHLCSFQVSEAQDGDRVIPNQVLIAPGGKQMRVIEKNGEFKIVIEDTEPVNRHKPSVDVLFNSMVKLGYKKMVGVILTGMGGDGAQGLLKLKNLGMTTLAQDEETSVVYGMPKEAFKIGAVKKVLPLEQIASEILLSCSKLLRKSG